MATSISDYLNRNARVTRHSSTSIGVDGEIETVRSISGLFTLRITNNDARRSGATIEEEGIKFAATHLAFVEYETDALGGDLLYDDSTYEEYSVLGVDELPGGTVNHKELFLKKSNDFEGAIHDVYTNGLEQTSTDIHWVTYSGTLRKITYGIDINDEDNWEDTEYTAERYITHNDSLTGLAQGTRYYFRIYSKTVSDLEIISNVCTFVTKDSGGENEEHARVYP